jgi:hypothetical protein
MTENNPRHPSSMSAEDLQALRAADPAAFDEEADASSGTDSDDAAADGADDDRADAGDAAADGAADDGAGADQDATADAADAADTAAPTAKDGRPDKVPVARLNEVIGQRNAAEELARQQAAELAELRARLASAAPPKDFDAEYAALLARYESNDIDSIEYEREKLKLLREETQHVAKVNALQAQQEGLESAVNRSWDDEARLFTSQHPEFFASAENHELFQRAVNAMALLHGDISNAALLAKAGESAFPMAGYTPPTASSGGGADANAAATQGQDAAAARRAQNAQRAADASAAPPAIAGGTGNRGGPERGVDLTTIKPGTFSKNLSRAEQEKLLGDGAL